ncbi:hypothetical protein D3C71_1897890 [compost metagenome]
MMRARATLPFKAKTALHVEDGEGTVLRKHETCFLPHEQLSVVLGAESLNLRTKRILRLRRHLNDLLRS